MATLGGAHAAGFDGSIGRIAPGYIADLTLLDRGSTYFHPANDLVAQLVHCEVGSSVVTVIVNGRVIVERGRMTTVDEQALLAEADEIGLRIKDGLHATTRVARELEPYLRQVYLNSAP
jgi:5-methylthioadenosine/S-adenosylhomocysteine deaminase